MGATEATELKLYIDNDADLYRRQTTYILKNLATKKAQGKYDHELAVKAFGYLADAGAKKYAKQFGGPDQPWNKMFDAGTRRRVAEHLTRDFEGEFALGNYDHLLPKKYQKKEKNSSTHHARKKGPAAVKATRWVVPEGLAIRWSPTNRAYFALWPGRGRVEDQQVLKVADAEDMHQWLRDTYGEPYGLTGRETLRVHHSRRKPGLHERLHDPATLRSATDRQLRGFYREEKRDVEKARAEARRRGVVLHARKKTPSQLDRDIAEHVPSWRRSR